MYRFDRLRPDSDRELRHRSQRIHRGCLGSVSSALVAIALLFATASPAATLRSQPAGVVVCCSSQEPDDASSESFRFPRDATITAIHWYGVEVSGVPSPDFRVSVYRDKQGLPNPNQRVTLFDGAVTRSATGRILPVSPFPDSPEYSYAASVAFDANGGTDYWLEIRSELSQGDGLWVLTSGLGGDGTFAFQTSSSTWTSQSGDFAFTLLGSITPKSVCGNDVREAPEICDGDDDALCSAGCNESCTCEGMPVPTLGSRRLTALFAALLVATAVTVIRVRRRAA